MGNMLTFQPLKLEDRSIIQPFLTRPNGRICDYSIGAVFLWRDFFHTEYACQDGALFFQFIYLDGKKAFSFPVSQDPHRALASLESYATSRQMALRFCNVPAEGLRVLQERYPQLHWDSDRDWFDYLYEAQDLITFRGKRFHGQKNHLNKFRQNHPACRWEEITPANAPEAKKFFLAYTTREQKKNRLLEAEARKILEYLDNVEQYRLLGGLLADQGEVLALSIGSKAGDTLFIHVEKARTDCPGVYQAIVSEFAAHYATEEIRYINREEDVGDLGLRTSKLSYHPVSLLEKYMVDVTL